MAPGVPPQRPEASVQRSDLIVEHPMVGECARRKDDQRRTCPSPNPVVDIAIAGGMDVMVLCKGRHVQNCNTRRCGRGGSELGSL